MKQPAIDPQEQAFVERALAAATRAQRWERVRVAVTLGAAISAAIWLASRPTSPELGIECTIVILVGTMLAVAAAKLRSLITRNTLIILQAIAAQRARPEPAVSSSGSSQDD